MTRKKGGGRESGNKSRGLHHHVLPVAANPAAQHDSAIASDRCDHAEWLHARIRTLEAANKELSDMLYELRAQRDYAIAVQEDRER